MELIECHNQCPDCLSMEIQVSPVLNSTDKFEVYFSANFNQQHENILNGKIKLGIRGGILKLSVDNAKIIESFSNAQLIIIDGGNYNQQKWQIKANPQENKGILKEQFSQVKLATIELNQDSYSLQSSFLVSMPDVSLTQIEGLWKYDLNPNKFGILERKLAHFFHTSYLTPYLSKTIFASKDFSIPPNSFSQLNKNLIEQKKLNLKSVIDNIYNAKTSDLHELAKIANLNLQTDLCGGNLVGADLSNIDLNGANLQYINFRGANLTDADLSETNLSYCKLSGADLSGAYLENSNLYKANLQSASLALANLIGANVSQANFTNTNLTNVTWSKSIAFGANFKNNLGLSQVDKDNLMASGAVFS